MGTEEYAKSLGTEKHWELIQKYTLSSQWVLPLTSSVVVERVHFKRSPEHVTNITEEHL